MISKTLPSPPRDAVPPLTVLGHENHPVSNTPEISLVIPAYNEGGNIGVAIQTISAEMRRLERSYELLVVDDGSTDNTVEVAKAHALQHPVRVVCLSRNFGKENAITAGLTRSLGEAVIVIDADLQEPISYLEVFIDHWDRGFQMVYAVRKHREDESLLKTWGSNAFYWMLNKMTTVPIPPHARDFRLMDQKVVHALRSLPERNRFMKGLFSWVGFKTKEVPVVIEKRHSGDSKFNYRRLLALALTGLTSFSDFPLRVWVGIGCCISLASILYAGLIAARTMIWGSDVPGWTTITVAVFFLGGIQILSIGVLGEYLARIFSEVKSRPNHIVSEEFTYLDVPHSSRP